MSGINVEEFTLKKVKAKNNQTVRSNNKKKIIQTYKIALELYKEDCNLTGRQALKYPTDLKVKFCRKLRNS